MSNGRRRCAELREYDKYQKWKSFHSHTDVTGITKLPRQLSVKIRRMMPHPAVLILLWIFLAVAMQSLHAAELLLVGVPLLVVAYILSATRLRTLLRRTRWIMLSLLFIYAYATPGVAVLPPLAQFSPTLEGLSDGLLQLGRLVFALAGLSILLSLLPQNQLISGLYVLGYPLRHLGLSRERMAVRLALTLQYAESGMPDAVSNWRFHIEQGLVPAAVPHNSIELQITPFALRDGLLLVLGGISLLVVIL